MVPSGSSLDIGVIVPMTDSVRHVGGLTGPMLKSCFGRQDAAVFTRGRDIGRSGVGVWLAAHILSLLSSTQPRLDSYAARESQAVE